MLSYTYASSVHAYLNPEWNKDLMYIIKRMQIEYKESENYSYEDDFESIELTNHKPSTRVSQERHHQLIEIWLWRLDL